MKKNLIMFFVTIVPLFAFSLNTYAMSAGYLGIDDYTSVYGSCSYTSGADSPDRAGASYVTNLKNRISNYYTTTYFNTDSSVVEYNIRNASKVDLFVYSGHGIALNSTDNALHCFARSFGNTWHNSSMEAYSDVNAITTDCSFNHNYVLTYACHWLENGTNSQKEANIWNTFGGTRMTLGYASTMYLDSREGDVFGQYLVNYDYTYQNAFWTATQYYQVQRTSGDTIARVMGYQNTMNDTMSSFYTGTIPTYSSSPSSFVYYWTRTIPHTGVNL